MRNKRLLLALSALLLVGAANPFRANAPASNEPMRKIYREGEKRHLRFIDVPPEVEESIVLPKPKGLIERLRELENNEFAKDKIYQDIDSLYKSMKIRHPYITREFIRAIIFGESFDSSTGKENPRAISKAGARGYMQIMKDSWYQVEKTDYYSNVFKPLKNTEVGMKIVFKIEKEGESIYPGWENLSDAEKAKVTLVGYNWGLRNFRVLGKWNWNKLPEETEEYLKKVERKEQEYQERKKSVYNKGLVLKLF